MLLGKICKNIKVLMDYKELGYVKFGGRIGIFFLLYCVILFMGEFVVGFGFFDVGFFGVICFMFFFGLGW